MKTIVVGLGNPILSDDGVGWVVVQAAETRYHLLQDAGDSVAASLPPVDFLCVALGGLSLMEHLIGYQRALLVDAIQSSQHPLGACLRFPLEALPDPTAGHLASTHDTSLLNALQVGRRLGADLPESITVLAIVAEKIFDFSEELSPPVAAAVPGAVQDVLDLLQTLSLEEV
jgi:hydrogenase maturation protease